MLKALRNKKTAKKIWIILAILIIPAFCLWGFGSAVRGREKSAFQGKVFGKSITTQEYLKNYKAIRDQYLIRLGEEELAKLEKHLNLEAQAWDRIILLAEAKRKKIKVSNKEVVDFIKRYSFFQKEGKFNHELYQEILTYVFRMNPRAFEEEIRDNLIIAKLYQEITQEITVTEDEIKNAYISENEQISLDYISASTENFLDQVTVEKEELLDYYNKNPEAFRKPLSYNLEYIRVDNKDKQTINKIMQLLNQGSGLSDLVKNTDLEIKETGLFSTNEPIPQIGWSTEILKMLPKLKPGGETWPQPIQTDADAAYFVRLKERKEPYTPGLNEIKDKVSQGLRQDKVNQITKEKLDACRKKAEISGIASAAKEFNLRADKTELFKRQSYVEGLCDSDIFFAAVQNLKGDQISQVIKTPSGVCIVKLNQRIKPSEEEFEEKKQAFSRRLLGERQQNYFRQFLTELKNKPNTFIPASLEKIF